LAALLALGISNPVPSSWIVFHYIFNTLIL
jgi:hypothetical protein